MNKQNEFYVAQLEAFLETSKCFIQKMDSKINFLKEAILLSEREVDLLEKQKSLSAEQYGDTVSEIEELKKD